MFRYVTLALTAAALTACASTSIDSTNTAKVSAKATNVEVLPPEPIVASEVAASKMADKLAGKNTDVLGNQLITNEKVSAAQVNTVAEPAAPTLENLYYVAQTKWEMMKFIEAVNAAELAAALEAAGAITVFAPTSDAFTRAGDVTADADLLKGHIVSGKYMAADLIARAAKGETTLPTLAGSELTLYVIGDAVKVADSSGRLYTVVTADNDASNGVLHMINGVFTAK